MTTSTEKSYFDLHITGLGYLNRIREVKPKKGDAFLACDIAALNGKLDIPLRSRHLIAVAQLAEHLIQERTAQSQTSEWQKLGSDCLACLDLAADDLPALADTCMAEISR